MVESGPLPRLTAETSFFWTSGADGRLRFLHCDGCSRYTHPPRPTCRSCGADRLIPQPVSGRGRLWSATTSYQKLLPEVEVPYTVAIVALAEQDDLHLTTRLVGVAPDDVRIGMALQVQFEPHDDVYLPLFGPAA